MNWFHYASPATFYPLAGRAKGWDAPPPQALNTSPERLLTELQIDQALEPSGGP